MPAPVIAAAAAGAAPAAATAAPAAAGTGAAAAAPAATGTGAAAGNTAAVGSGSTATAPGATHTPGASPKPEPGNTKKIDDPAQQNQEAQSKQSEQAEQKQERQQNKKQQDKKLEDQQNAKTEENSGLDFKDAITAMAKGAKKLVETVKDAASASYSKIIEQTKGQMSYAQMGDAVKTGKGLQPPNTLAKTPSPMNVASGPKQSAIKPEELMSKLQGSNPGSKGPGKMPMPNPQIGMGASAG